MAASGIALPPEISDEGKAFIEADYTKWIKSVGGRGTTEAAMADKLERRRRKIATASRTPGNDGQAIADWDGLFLVGKRGFLCLKIGNQVLKAIKRPLVGHLTGQPFKMAKFLIDLVTVFAH
jgi:hypothetical protein